MPLRSFSSVAIDIEKIGTRVLKEPLTHHQILHIAAEFAERGYLLDLGGSSRIDRRLSFKPRLHDNLANGFRIVFLWRTLGEELITFSASLFCPTVWYRGLSCPDPSLLICFALPTLYLSKEASSSADTTY